MSENVLYINRKLSIPLSEISIKAIRSGGPGGQHVNKVSTAIELRYNLYEASLTEEVKLRLLKKLAHRITREGELIIQDSSTRSQNRNRQLALDRLKHTIQEALVREKKRIPTRISAKKKQKRREDRIHKSRKKALRRKIYP